MIKSTTKSVTWTSAKSDLSLIGRRRRLMNTTNPGTVHPYLSWEISQRNSVPPNRNILPLEFVSFYFFCFIFSFFLFRLSFYIFFYFLFFFFLTSKDTNIAEKILNYTKEPGFRRRLDAEQCKFHNIIYYNLYSHLFIYLWNSITCWNWIR